MSRFFACVCVLLWALGSSRAAPPQDSCVTCHALLENKQAEPAKVFDADVHHQAGLGCADCHGGDAKDESMNAMSRAKGFRGAPKKAQIPEFCARCHAIHNMLPASDTRSPVNPANVAATCGRCHSNAAYMQEYKIPSDQVARYQKSVHAQ